MKKKTNDDDEEDEVDEDDSQPHISVRILYPLVVGMNLAL